MRPELVLITGGELCLRRVWYLLGFGGHGLGVVAGRAGGLASLRDCLWPPYSTSATVPVIRFDTAFASTPHMLRHCIRLDTAFALTPHSSRHRICFDTAFCFDITLASTLYLLRHRIYFDTIFILTLHLNLEILLVLLP